MRTGVVPFLNLLRAERCELLRLNIERKPIPLSRLQRQYGAVGRNDAKRTYGCGGKKLFFFGVGLTQHTFNDNDKPMHG